MRIKKLSAEWLLLLSINLVIGIALILMHVKTNSEPSHISDSLQAIQTQLGTLQSVIKTPAEKIDLTAVDEDFNKLTTLIGELKGKDEGQLNQLVIESRKELAHKLDAMHTVVSSLDKKQHPIKYLSVTALPFKVISIDSIQAISVASVTYDYKTIPLEKSETLAGWTVLSVDFSKQRIELENVNKERVVVALEGVEQHA